MSDLKKYIDKRKLRDSEFNKDYESGYQEFKIGAILSLAREEAGLTQKQLAEKFNTKKKPSHAWKNLPGHLVKPCVLK